MAVPHAQYAEIQQTVLRAAWATSIAIWLATAIWWPLWGWGAHILHYTSGLVPWPLERITPLVCYAILGGRFLARKDRPLPRDLRSILLLAILWAEWSFFVRPGAWAEFYLTRWAPWCQRWFS